LAIVATALVEPPMETFNVIVGTSRLAMDGKPVWMFTIEPIGAHVIEKTSNRCSNLGFLQNQYCLRSRQNGLQNI